MAYSISLAVFALIVHTLGLTFGVILTLCWTHGHGPATALEMPAPPLDHRSWHDDAVHMTIIVLDIASFTHPARKWLDQRTVHNGLHTMLRSALADSGIPPAACRIEDRGDGALILVPPDYPKRWLVERWLTLLVARLHEHNATHSYTSEMQVRVACHAGEVHVTAHGVVSHAVNLAFELVDAHPAKEALKISDSVIALVVSDSFYQDVITQLPRAIPDGYDRILVAGKRMESTAWLYLPGHRTSAEPGDITGTPAAEPSRRQAAIG